VTRDFAYNGLSGLTLYSLVTILGGARRSTVRFLGRQDFRIDLIVAFDPPGTLPGVLLMHQEGALWGA
jgi:hypothetical protein